MFKQNENLNSGNLNFELRKCILKCVLIESSTKRDDDSDYARYVADSFTKRERKQTEKVNSENMPF